MKVWIKGILLALLMICTMITPVFAEMPTNKLSVKLSISPSKKMYQIGESITIKSEVVKKAEPVKTIITVNGEEISPVQSIEKSGKIIATATYIPQRAGTFTIQSTVRMLDLVNMKMYEGTSKKDIKVEGAKLTLTASPLTASMKLGDDLYLLLKYPIFQINKDKQVKLETNFEDLIDEVSTTEKNGFYLKLLKFTPEKSGSHKLKITVNNETIEGATNITISVKK